MWAVLCARLKTTEQRKSPVSGQSAIYDRGVGAAAPTQQRHGHPFQSAARGKVSLSPPSFIALFPEMIRADCSRAPVFAVQSWEMGAVHPQSKSCLLCWRTASQLPITCALVLVLYVFGDQLRGKVSRAAKETYRFRSAIVERREAPNTEADIYRFVSISISVACDRLTLSVTCFSTARWRRGGSGAR
jgi:hypothetical protein